MLVDPARAARLRARQQQLSVERRIEAEAADEARAAGQISDEEHERTVSRPKSGNRRHGRNRRKLQPE